MENTKSSSDLTHELSNISSQLGLIENYFSCILLGSLTCDLSLIQHTLFKENGISNARETLRVLKKQIEVVTDKLVDHDLVDNTEERGN